MKGLVFNLLKGTVSQEAGAAAWERAVAESGADGSVFDAECELEVVVAT
jgi:hypothetical protein